MADEKVVAYIARHGSTLGNKENLLKGPENFPLDSHGLKQARQQAQFLLGLKIGEVYSSPVKRAYDTAKTYMLLAGRSTDNDVLIQERKLCPLDCGALEGIDRKEWKKSIKLFIDNPEIKFPRGESLDDLRKRADSFFRHEIGEVESGKEPLPCLSFTHDSVIRAVVHMVIGGDDEHEIVKPSGVLAIIKTKDGYDAEVIYEPKDFQL